MFSLGMRRAHVVFIRLSNNSTATSATQSLVSSINALASEIGVHLENNNLFRVGVKEAEILPDLQSYLLKRAQDGLDMVRMHVFSHVDWLYHVNEAINEQYPGQQWTDQTQKWIWLSSLQNGVGQKAVGKIFDVYLKEQLPLAEFSSPATS